jgi:hypothetical protein
MTPSFSWAEQKQAAAPTALTIAIDADLSRTHAFQQIPVAEHLSIGLAFGSQMVGDMPGVSMGAIGPELAGAGFERSYFAPTVTRRIGDDTTVSASAVFVYQQFATWGLGAGVSTQSLSAGPPLYSTRVEESVGSGFRLQFNREIQDGLGFVTSVQSRVNMDAFQAYRGVYSDPGDFDIPSIAAVGLSWNANDSLTIGAGVSRVMWSDVTAFTSRALPRRVLRLLGDGTSPEFAWRDLTVVGVNFDWRATPVDAFNLTLTTHQQPEPTAALLRQALTQGSSNMDLGLNYAHDFGRAGSLSLGASYAPVEYFLGNSSYADRNSSGNVVEVEAVWTTHF